MDWKPRVGDDRIWNRRIARGGFVQLCVIASNPSTPEGAGVIPDELPATQLHPPFAYIRFTDIESTRTHPLALLNASGERMWTTQVFHNVARSAHPSLELSTLTPLYRNPRVGLSPR